MPTGPGRYIGQGVSLASVAESLSWDLHRPVVDKTGLTGKYDVSLTSTPDLVKSFR